MGNVKLLDNLKFLEKTKLNLVSKIFPVKRTEILLFDKIEIDLRESKINQINILPISSPEITSDLSIVKPILAEQKIAPTYVQIITCKNTECSKKLRMQIDNQLIGRSLKIQCPICNYAFIYCLTKDELIGDLTPWLKEQLFYPEIETIPVLIVMPARAGKSYKKFEADDRQTTLFEKNEGDQTCIHGVKKSWCSICIEKKRQDIERPSSHVDLFDIIFPILQPPLGENFDSPIAFPSLLFPFQRTGIKFLIDHERALLADEMGLGKSIQAIVAIRFLLRMGKVTNCLVLCPKSVLTDWAKKLWEWAPELRVVKIRGAKEQRQVSWNNSAHIYLTTYETLRQDLSASLRELREKEPKTLSLFNDTQEIESEEAVEDIARKQFDLIVLDEIQKTKNPGANITKASRQIDASFRWGLSGTPLENRLDDLISIFAYLKPGLLHYDDALKPLKVKEAIKPYFLRRRKADALPELPEKHHEEAWLELSTAQRETYDKAEKEGIVELNEKGDSVTVTHILALITKLKQICNIDPVSQESCKIEYLLEKLEEVSEQDDKALVFSQYPEKTLKVLEPKLEQFNTLIYHGSLSDSQRDQIVKRFQEEEKSKVLLMSVKAGGLGLTLTRANFVFHFDLWWNPSTATQAEDRTHRIGQEKTVFVTTLFTVDTIEEKIYNLLKRKRELFKAVIDDLSDTNLTKILTEEELLSLFNLKKVKPGTKPVIPNGGFTIESFRQISPQQFERLISSLYEKMGYQVKQTPQTRDQGVDIFAKRVGESGPESLAIQCKHYQTGPVGVEHSRSLYGVIQDQPSITKGILVTSGEFSRECMEFARNKRIFLIDGKYLVGLLEKYGVSHLEFI